MNYEPKFIEGVTIEDIDEELEQIAYNEYRYGRSIDRPRMWDLHHTRKILEEEKGLDLEEEDLEL